VKVSYGCGTLPLPPGLAIFENRDTDKESLCLGWLGDAIILLKVALSRGMYFDFPVSFLIFIKTKIGGFSFVYLVKDITESSQSGSMSNSAHGSMKHSNSDSGGRSSGTGGSGGSKKSDAAKVEMVLKVTSILSRQQRDIAEKEAKLLSRLSHPSIIKMFDTCYRTVAHSSKRGKEENGKTKERPQHLILMEFCEGGHALDVCNQLAVRGERFDLSQLIIAFGQICNAVSYLHAQRPPIVHRDLKPANFLVKNTGYKLCDFGSAVFGHVELKTPEDRAEAEEVIQKTTTQMFRAPEMVDLYMAKKLTQATDVWALGCCLYSLAFLQNCFEEGSNLAILSRKYKIPEDNPYGDGLVELLDRMLTVDSKARADMTEVILCLSAVYSGRPLPPRKDRKPKKEDKEENAEGDPVEAKKSKKHEKAGTFRTDGQGIYKDLSLDPKDPSKQKEAKKLNPNSAAARRRAAAASTTTVDPAFSNFDSKFEEAKQKTEVNPDLAFSTDGFNAFDIKTPLERKPSGADDVFGALAEAGDPEVKNAFENAHGWEDSRFDTSFDAFGSSAKDESDNPANTQAPEEARKRRPRQKSKTVRPRKEEDKATDSMDNMNLEDDGGDTHEGEDAAGRSRRSATRRIRRTTSGTHKRAPADGRGTAPRRPSQKDRGSSAET
jgi:serine/threonine protein kinase